MIGMSAGTAAAAVPANSRTFPGVLPTPKEYRETVGLLRLVEAGGTLRVAVHGEHPALRAALRDLRERLRSFRVTVEPGEADAPIWIAVGGDASASAPVPLPALPEHAESYVLKVAAGAPGEPTRAAVLGRDPAGAYFGVQTLIQLLDESELRVTIRPAEVRDWPTFSLRMFKGQCWYYRDNRALARWAPRFKWNAFGPCYTDCPDWRDPPSAYCHMIAEVCDAAHGDGVLRLVQLGNPYMLKDKAIRATAPGDVDALAAFFELSLSHGSDALMLCLDDFAYLPTEDAAKFASLAAANASLVKEFHARVTGRHPGTRLLLCPPPYWLNANRAKGYEWAHDYLRDLCGQIPADIAIVWTGLEVTTPCQQAADVHAYQRLVGPSRKLMLWDNTLKLPPGWGNVFRMNAFLETCDDVAGSAWPTMAERVGGAAVINTYGPGAIYKVPLMTAADYLWNPEAYEAKESLRRALYWFDDNRALGPMVYRWVNELHQKLFTARLAFLKAPSNEKLVELRTLTREYETAFAQIASETDDAGLVATLQPYLRRHTRALPLLAWVGDVYRTDPTDRANIVANLEVVRQKFGELAYELRKGDPADERYGCVQPDLENQTDKAMEALLATLKTPPAAKS